MAVLNTGLAKTSAEAYTIDYSCRFDGSSSHMYRLPSETGNKTTWAWSCWVKKCGQQSYQMLFGGINTSGAAARSIFIGFDNTDRLVVNDWHDLELYSERKFRDPSAWMHIFMQYDSTQTTDSNRIKIWVNGEVHALTENTGAGGSGWDGYPPEDHETMVNMASEYSRIGNNNATRWFDGYMAEMHFFDGASIFSDDSGSANTGFNVNSFGETGDYGEWKPKEYDGDAAHGTNGFYFDFSDSAALGDDASGSVDWTVSNIDAADQMLDTPTNNFCTLNPIATTYAGAGFYEKGNLGFDSDGNVGNLLGTIGVTSGKWYYEYHEDVISTSAYHNVGFANIEFPNEGGAMSDMITNEDTWGMGLPNGSEKWNGEGYWNGTVWGSWTQSDTLGLAIDVDAGKVWFSVNGTWISSGDPAAGTGEAFSGLPASTYSPCATPQNHAVVRFNFGADSSFAGNLTAQGNQDGNGIGDFQYTPPTGFLALCTSNLATPAVNPSEHFNIVLYDGDGTTSNAITGVGFQPDFVWLKMRTANIMHVLIDAIRGVTKRFNTSTDGEITEGTFVSFDADGFTVNENVTDGSHTNDDEDTFVAWNWKAASTASGTTTGSGTGKAYSARYNTDAGFSIITYEGNDTAGHTIPHHLSKAPELFIIKAREHTDPWCLFHHNLHPSTPEQYADEMNALASFHDSDYWNDTAPTSSVFTVGSSNNINGNDVGYMAYCWHSVDGYSKVGTYEGNDDADGAFVYLGFRPAYVWIKNIDASSNWHCLDSTRKTYNPMQTSLQLNITAAEWDDAAILDFTSNGFKLRDGDNLTNEETYIYFAIAETPFKYSNAR